MKIAVFLSDTNPSRGGGYQYELKISNLIDKIDRSKYKITFITSNKTISKALNDNNINNVTIKLSIINKFFDYLLKNNYIKKYLNILNIFTFEQKLSKYKFDLIYFLSPNNLIKYVHKHNLITTVWDQCHRDNVEFPEVAHKGQFKQREELIHENIKRSFSIIVETEKSKLNFNKRYGVDLDRIKVLPCTPSDFVDKYKNIDQKEINETIQRLSIKKNFIFYPAQLWAHKNHSIILEALNIIVNKKKIDLKFYFCGQDKGNLSYLKKLINKLNLNDHVKYLGFLNDKDIVALYKTALALVMPTYFGNANIPPLDAFKLSCPVIYTKFDENDHLFNNSIWEIDLHDGENLSNKILELMNNEIKKKEKIQNGLKYLENISDNKVVDQIEKLFEKYSVIRKTWE